MGDIMRFWPLESKVDVTFWSPLGELKLHSLRLEEGPVALRGGWAASDRADLPGLLTVTAASLLCPDELEGASHLDKAEGTAGAADAAAAATAAGAAGLPPRSFEAQGELWVLNTPDRLLTFDRKAAIQKACDHVWAAIQSGAAESDPRLLQPALLLAYCDLKHFKYRYWFAFPALQPPQPFGCATAAASMAAVLGSEAAAAVAAACSAHVTATGLPAWLVRLGGSGGGAQADVATAPLTDWHRLQQEMAGSSSGAGGGGGGGGSQAAVFLAVADSSNQAAHPGWPLRNLLLMAAARWQCRRLRVLCLRERHGRYDPAASLALEASLPELPLGFTPVAVGGWEPNERGKPGPRTADLAPAMDPRRLAEAAVELNLRLMRWRAAPALDVGAIADTRCLLLGAGTLGCSVARTLLGWGVRHITLVDSSRVAYSNPVRQSLYTFQDCLAGGKPKAVAAAEALAAVFPGVSARGVQLSIPMPGHPIAEPEMEQVERDIAALEALVDAHDTAFLLTDTRESRWLPTLLCAARGCLAINAALGFDGYMVMRHGAPLPPEEREAPGREAAAAAAQAEEPAAAEAAAGQQLAGAGSGGVPAGNAAAAAGGSGRAAAAAAGSAASGGGGGGTADGAGACGGAARLGCYFCNDVVAPLNSTADRAMDQQCTVARPGLSGVAGALAAELLAAVVAHPAGAAAPAAGTEASRRAAAAAAQQLPLGEVPHMVRGQLSGFSQLCLAGQAFRQCTACSPAVVQEYRRRGTAFVLQGLLNPKYLEDLTGLTELHRASEAALEAWGEEQGGEEEEGGGGGAAAGEDRGQGGGAAAEEGWEEL